MIQMYLEGLLIIVLKRNKNQQHFFLDLAIEILDSLLSLKRKEPCTFNGFISFQNYGQVLYILYIASLALLNP